MNKANKQLLITIPRNKGIENGDYVELIKVAGTIVQGENMTEKKPVGVVEHKPDEITFWMSDKVPEGIIRESDLTPGEQEKTIQSFQQDSHLVAVKSTIGSFPKHKIDDLKEMKLTPTQYMRKLGTDEGLSQENINKALNEAFKDD
jgi:hypothetical protein